MEKSNHQSHAEYDQLMVVFYDVNELMEPAQTDYMREDKLAQIVLP